MEKRMNQFKQVYLLATVLLTVLLTGCFDIVEGVPCSSHDDCASGICEDGVCVGVSDADADSDSDADSDADSDSDTDTDTDTDIDTEIGTEFDTEIGTEFDTEIATDTGVEYTQPMTGVDILFVVDNSGSMAEEQEILKPSILTLMNKLEAYQKAGISLPLSNVRVGVTTTDMGVSYGENGYDGTFTVDPRCVMSPYGNDGQLVDHYGSNEIFTESMDENIHCIDNVAQCPQDWVCTYMNDDNAGVCSPLYDEADITLECPELVESPWYPAQSYVAFNDETAVYQDAALAVGCLAGVGTNGCNFEQQLSASYAALTKHGQGEFLLRPDAYTVVVVVSDEDDCSIESGDWHNLSELGSTAVNMACGLHQDLLYDVDALKAMIIDAKTAATGVPAAGSVMFAAITGVPTVAACQGRGDAIGGCLDVELSQGGTMGDPAIIERSDPNGTMAQYFEYACTRDNADGQAVTKAYPAHRLVKMAQQFGQNGYVYSICNEDWTPAMIDIAERITTKMTLIEVIE